MARPNDLDALLAETAQLNQRRRTPTSPAPAPAQYRRPQPAAAGRDYPAAWWQQEWRTR